MNALRTYYRGHRLVGVRQQPAGQAASMRYFHFDHQGTTQALTDSTGAVTDRFACDAWGVQVKRTGTSINRQWYVGNLGYTRQVDQVLDYVRARYLVLQLAMFSSKDPLSNPRTILSSYVYGANSPCRFVDPFGKTPCGIADFTQSGRCDYWNLATGREEYTIPFPTLNDHNDECVKLKCTREPWICTAQLTGTATADGTDPVWTMQSGGSLKGNCNAPLLAAGFGLINSQIGGWKGDLVSSVLDMGKPAPPPKGYRVACTNNFSLTLKWFDCQNDAGLGSICGQCCAACPGIFGIQYYRRYSCLYLPNGCRRTNFEKCMSSLGGPGDYDFLKT